MTRRTEVLADSPLIFLELEETSGNPTNSGSESLTYTVGTGVTRNVAGQDGQAWQFDGTANGYVRLGGSSQANYTDKIFSVEFWVKTAETANQVLTYFNLGGSGGSFQININATGKVDAFMAGSGGAGSSLISTTTIRGTTWHHVVLTVNGDTRKLYIDGNLEDTDTTTMGTFSPTATNWDLGVYQNAGSAAMTLDSYAVFNSELSATRVSDHFTGGAAPVHGGYTAQVMTASALMVNPAVSTQTIISGGYTAQGMTASASQPDAVGRGNAQIGTILADTYTRNDFPTVTFGSDTFALIGLNSGGVQYQTTLIKTSQPSLVGDETLVSANLTLKAAAAWPADTYEVYRITSDWAESTVTHNTKPSMTLVGTVAIPAKSTGDLVTIDIASVFNATNYGVALMRTINGGSGSQFYTKEHATAANRPKLTFAVGAAQDASVPATPLTASALIVDPVTTTTAGVSESGQPMNASAALVNPTLDVKHDEDVPATVLTASAAMGNSGFAMPVSNSASPAEATATLVGAVVATERGPKIAAAPMSAIISWKQPEAINGSPIVLDESEDAYYTRVNNLGPESWWRLNDHTSTVTDRVGGDANGAYLSVVFGQRNGPEDRASAYFDGDGFIQGTALETSPVPGTLEFSFRTTRANSYLMLSADDRIGALATIDEPNREIYLSNGRITFKTYYFQTSLGGQPEPTTFTGSRNLADGEWHHIVIRPFQGSNGAGTEIWVDGKFEVRRYGAGSWNGMPDYTGGRPGIPTSQYLIGDMAEIIYYEKAIATDDIKLNYYAFMGWVPIEAEPMEAFAFTPAETTGRGNQKKALYLYWDLQSEVFKDSGGQSEQFGSDDIEFDPMTDFVSITNPLATGEYHGFKVFAKPITNNGFGVAYRDPYTDEPSLINLETDVNLDEFDVIMFKDWPDESGPENENKIELDFVERTFPGQKERLLQQLRDANDAGIGLYVTQPRLAVDLGIINRVEFIPTLHESKSLAGQGNARGLYDYGSAVKFPWDIAASDGLSSGIYSSSIGQPKTTNPAYLANKALFYSDTNKNNKFRVRALVDGLTNIPSYMIEDAVFHVDYDMWGWQGLAYKYLHRLNGLQVGDEFIFNGSEIINHNFEEKVDYRYSRYFGTFATPVENVKVGTVVTTFGSTHWKDTNEATNPYRDYATTIVLDEGDVLAGRPVGGRIFVNFTEQPTRGNGLPVQVLPGSEYDAANPFLLNPDELEFVDDGPVFRSQGTPDKPSTPEQDSIIAEALSRCTFPLQALAGRMQSVYGRPYIQVVWEDIDPGENESGAGQFNRALGRLSLDDASISEHTSTDEEYRNAAMKIFLHEVAHVIDAIYLASYQRVNIWNMFHSDWNLWHEGTNDTDNEWILPDDYEITWDSPVIHNDEGWFKSTLPAEQYTHGRIGEAWADAFVQAYSDVPLVIGWNAFPNHPSPEEVGPLLRAAIETGPQDFLFKEQADTSWPFGYPAETDEQREWEYSWTRVSLVTSSATAKTSKALVRMPDGTTMKVDRSQAEGDLLFSARSNQLFPVITVPHFHMGARGMYWLSTQPEKEPGSARAKAEAMTATAEMPSPTVTAERDTNYNARAMLANATITNVDESVTKDTTVVSFPMEADALMTGIGTTVMAEPMTAHAELVENFDLVHASGEQVVLYLHSVDLVTLYLKEEV